MSSSKGKRNSEKIEIAAEADDGDFPGHLLHQAALWDNCDLLLDLLRGELRTQIESQDSWGRTALHAAATTQDSKCLRPLLQAGANPNALSGAQDNFKTPLHTSAEHGFSSNVRILVAGGADIFRLEGRALTAADLAQRGGHTDTYRYLLSITKEQEDARENLHREIRDAVSLGDVDQLKKLLSKPGVLGDAEKRELLNKTPHGTNTLLFKAAESGNADLVKILIENGADGRIHPVTKYSPLYIAAYHGHKHILNLLLAKFPGLVQVPTVEKWLPLHAACINGHTLVLETLLNYKYPQELLSSYAAKIVGEVPSGSSEVNTTKSQEIQVEMPFDLNAKDVSDQTALYIACQMGNPRLVDILLKFKLPVKTRAAAEDVTAKSPTSPTESDSQKFPTAETSQKRRLSSGIQGILSKLSIATNQELLPRLIKGMARPLASPLDINSYCEEYQTSLHVAVKSRNHIIASNLLHLGRADPNLPIRPRPPQLYDTHSHSHSPIQSEPSEPSTALVEACKLRDLGMIDLLLKWGARDEDSKALFASLSAKDDIVVGKLLALKAHADSENRVVSPPRPNRSSSSIFPTIPVTIDWHAKRLDKITESWLTMAALRLNPKLRLCPRTQTTYSLAAITRLDLSSNSLTVVPPAIFSSLSSLVYLNLSQNKISNLGFGTLGSGTGITVINENLRDLLLQENRLEWCPTEIFTEFPNLLTLNLANNKLTALPASMWLTPNLQELNVSLNLLSDLPLVSQQHQMSLSLMETSSSSWIQLGTGDTNEELMPDQLLQHQATWRRTLRILTEDQKNLDDRTRPEDSPLLVLNLSHNLFQRVPTVLPCLATRLQRLNLSFNRLEELGNISEYPGSLKYLDLSSNSIKTWFESTHYAKKPCYGILDDEENGNPSGRVTCKHKLSRLENLRSFILAGNRFETICLTTLDDPSGNLVFPNLTLLDVSENRLSTIPPRISDLSGLSVLNLSGNKELVDLPPEIGLLSRIWNLNLSNCPNLQEPLKNLVDRKRSKTADLIGYLRSVLEKSVPYTRMKLMIVGVHGIGKTTLLSLLRQEAGSSGTGASSHGGSSDNWAKRMGTVGSGVSHTKSKQTGNLSTVGVDIGSLILDPPKGYTSNTPDAKGSKPIKVHFRTWDFGGQKEYYATHLYFLSKRSLYLVLWNVTDGEKGLSEVHQWLVNIQSRAPNSTVLIVGTHYDLVHEKFPPGYLAHLQSKIRERFLCIPDPEKRGLPRTIGAIEISCRNRTNVKQLGALIYDTVVNLKTANGKLLLDQRIPSKYVHLEEIVAFLANERKSQGLDPVMQDSEFREAATSWLQKAFNLKFRDDAEISQACTFLHDNGILLHFEDSTLRELYFLDPQWLCDMLATVVTVREINPFAKNGIMATGDLVHLFKAQSAATREYVLSLLSKFELAIPWDEQHLLIPSMLPPAEAAAISAVKVKIPVRSRRLQWRNSLSSSNISGDCIENSKMYRNLGSFQSPRICNDFKMSKTSKSFENPEISEEYRNLKVSKPVEILPLKTPNLPPLRRFVILSYFPSGFWPRLIIRILGDDRIVDIIRNYFGNIPAPSDLTPEVISILDRPAEFSCFQTGLELTYGDLSLLKISQAVANANCGDTGTSTNYSFLLRRDDMIYSESSGSGSPEPGAAASSEESEVWDVVELESLGLLEIHLPALSLSIAEFGESGNEVRLLLSPSIEAVSKLMALVVDHVDTLLEDWFPNIGSRFVHTSEGKYLVTRLLPCPNCFPNNFPLDPSDPAPRSGGPGKTKPRSCDSGMGISPNTTTTIRSVDSVGSGDSSEEYPAARTRAGAILFETPKFGSGSNSGLNFFLPSDLPKSSKPSLYAWSIEHCILEAQGGISSNSLQADEAETVAAVKCPKHGLIPIHSIAPDVLFLDISPQYLLSGTREIERKRLIGRGAFGFVFAGTLRPREAKSGPESSEEIAIKLFQPVDPGISNPEAQQAYRIARAKFHRSPAHSACRHYLAARGEIRVLSWLSHPNIVPFIGVTQAPLAIIMPRAPSGALDSILADFRRSGDHLAPTTVQVTIVQLGRALEYLHENRIIYRDLKSENVLVWKFPEPFGIIGDRRNVDVKLADYGISRSSFTTGSKGFAGTEGFMAPEIIRYNGEEEYTSKVDIFSFGMVIYEILSLKQPFADGTENVKESILEGDRPGLNSHQLQSATLYALDLMISSWSQSPKDRPTASQIISIANSPEFPSVRDVVLLSSIPNVVTSLLGRENEVWVSCSTGDLYSLNLDGSFRNFSSSKSMGFVPDVVTAMGIISVGEESKIWMGDTVSKIHVFGAQGHSDCNVKISEVELEPTLGLLGAVVSIQGIANQDVTAVAFSSGRIFLLRSESLEVIMEIGKDLHTVIHTLGTRILPDGQAEIWSGERAGKMRVFCLQNSSLVSTETISHYETTNSTIEALQVLLISSHPNNELMFSYVFPGTVIYGWDPENREMISRLDVGKLLPSNRAELLDREELLMKPLQVTVLTTKENSVLVGTNWGYVFLCSLGLSGISIIQPFSGDVRSILVLSPSTGESLNQSNTGDESPTPTSSTPPPLRESQNSTSTPKLILFGREYQHLIHSKLEKSRGTHEKSTHRKAYAILADLPS